MSEYESLENRLRYLEANAQMKPTDHTLSGDVTIGSSVNNENCFWKAEGKHAVIYCRHNSWAPFKEEKQEEKK